MKPINPNLSPLPPQADTSREDSRPDGHSYPQQQQHLHNPNLNPMVNNRAVAGRPEIQILDPKPVGSLAVQHMVDEGLDEDGSLLWKISGFREHDGIYVHIDTYKPGLCDNHELKKRAYDYRLLIGMGNAGIEPSGSHFQITQDERPASLLPFVEGKCVWRRLFKLNSPV